MTIKLQYEQTKHKRPILFIVPARTASTVLQYTVHGKNKDLFGLQKHDSTDGFLALYYKKKVTPILGKSVIHHVRVLGTSIGANPGQQEKNSSSRNRDSNKKELNMKVKIVVLAK